MLSPTIHGTRPRRLEKKHVWRALIVEAESFIPHDHFSIRTSPRFWGKVFQRVYGTASNGRTDPRWDPLLKTGFALIEYFYDH